MIAVLLVGDHACNRQALAAAMRLEGDIEVVADVECADAGTIARRTEPSVAVVSILVPQTRGVDAIRDIRSQPCGTKVLVLTALTNDILVGHWIETGAAAVVHTSVDLAEFLATLRIVADGASVLTANQTSRCLRALAAARERDWHGRMVRGQITAREKHEVLRRLADGAGTDEIAARLHITRATAQTHVRNLLAKLNVRSRVAAVAEAGRLGLLDDRSMPALSRRLPR